MQVTAKFFSLDRVTIGKDQLTVELPDGSTIRQLIQAIQQEFSAFKTTQGGIHFLVNQVNANLDTVLHEGDEILFLRQLSGG